VTTEAVRLGAGRRLDVRRLAASWHVPALAGVLALAAFLDFFRLSRNGYANEYYAAAVRSMLRSWHNFFFVSFDPGGLVSVDKPPLALWLEAASARLFGYSGFAILLPEALAGVVAVWITYLLVARWLGRVAGLLAALALAVSPVSVAVNRDNNPDALLALLLVLAVYVGARAIRSGRLPTLLLSALIVGLAFNTKMLAAMIVVPGLVLGYLVFAPGSRRRRLAHLLAAGAVLVVVSGAWIAAVELTPAADRPYVGSTTDNSALSLAFDYNGLGRVTGQTGGTSTGGGGLGGAFSGSPGWLRLINDALGDQGGWVLPLAIVGGLSLLVALAADRRRHRRELGVLVAIGGWFAVAAAVFSFSSGIIHTYYLSALAPATAALVGAGAVALWRDARRGGPRLAWPLAALALCAWLELDLLRRSGYLPWLQALVIAGVTAAAAVLFALAAPGWPERRRRTLAAAALGLGVGTLLAAPAAWSATTLKSAVDGVFPGAGPNFVSGLSAGRSGAFLAGPRTFGGASRPAPPSGLGPPAGLGGGTPPAPPAGAAPGGLGGGRSPGAAAGAGPAGAAGSTGIADALAYVKTHGASSRFGLIVQNEQEAASSVIAGEPVASMGGFTGRETVLTSTYLARLVRSGEARYFLLGETGFRGGPGGTSNAAVATITSACTVVASASWAESSSAGGTLYDCAGKADAISGGRG
jgi:4-amino-4-deoxy-L-arabinose transferase-like glycosyltransferase